MSGFIMECIRSKALSKVSHQTAAIHAFKVKSTSRVYAHMHIDLPG